MGNLSQEIIGEGAWAGRFRADMPAEIAARMVFGAIDELITAWVLASRPQALSRQADPLVRMLLQGLAAEGGKRHG